MGSPGPIPKEPENKSVLNTVPKKVIKVELAGLKCIQIELTELGKKAEISTYSEKYSTLVSDIANAVKDKLKGLKGDELETAFIKESWNYFKSRFKPKWKGSDAFLAYSINDNEYDCDTSAIIFHDVGNLLSIKTSFIIAPEHLLLKTDKFLFETTTGKVLPVSNLEKRYPVNYVLGPNSIPANSHRCLSVYYYNQNNFVKAIKYAQRSLEFDPKASSTYSSLLGNSYSRNNQPKEALEAYNRALKLYPADHGAYVGKGNVYLLLHDYEKAVIEYTNGIARCPPNSEHYAFYHRNRAMAYQEWAKIDSRNALKYQRLSAEDIRIFEKLKK